MMELDFAWLVLLEEAIGVGLLITIAVFAKSRNRRGKEIAQIERFLSQFEADEAIKNSLLETILTEKCGVNPEAAAMVLRKVVESERALLQMVVKMLLNRDPSCLAEIDQLIVKMSEPYCKLLAETGLASAESNEAGNDNQVVGLKKVNKQLMRQLDTAMQTIDEISSEYTRVFSGHQTQLELDNSSKKMQQIFRDVEQRIMQNIADMEN
jgi:hypothetical protein